MWMGNNHNRIPCRPGRCGCGCGQCGCWWDNRKYRAHQGGVVGGGVDVGDIGVVGATVRSVPTRAVWMWVI